MSRAHDAHRIIDVHPDVALGEKLGLPGMHPYAHPYRCVLRPHVRGKGTLDRNGCGDRIAGASKDDEKGIALGIHLLTMPLPDCATQHLPTLGQDASIALA